MKAGYFKGAGRVEHLKVDSDLDPLRRRDDFRTAIHDGSLPTTRAAGPRNVRWPPAASFPILDRSALTSNDTQKAKQLLDDFDLLAGLQPTMSFC